MSINELVTESIGPVKNLLDLAALRHRALSQNLANVNTANYIRQDVNFERVLREAIRSDDLKSPMEFEFVPDKTRPFKSDGNNVNLEYEVAQLNKNQMLHEMAAQFLRGRLDHYKTAIAGRAS